uniref:Uncharacterized protein n=1 Tax=Noctiluca scintillans TaxID=2966 RepID=A0A7S1FJQ8_NOCSC|mmetsp:Transcript_704/g.1916  ORF Transcript_704/g.1916 Transcript_704/m.1916 type:complete len:264 (+) Transcript_704:65-856(+)
MLPLRPTVIAKCAGALNSLTILMLIISVSSPWWTRTKGDTEEQTVGLWTEDRDDDWPGAVRMTADIDDQCDHSEEYNTMCKKVSALRAFCILGIIVTFLSMCATIVSLGFSSRVVRIRRPVSSELTTSDGSTKPVDEVVPNPRDDRGQVVDDDSSQNFYRAGAGLVALCLLFSVLGLIIGAITEVPGSGWSLAGPGFVCLAVSLVFSIPSFVALLMASDDVVFHFFATETDSAKLNRDVREREFHTRHDDRNVSDNRCVRDRD